MAPTKLNFKMYQGSTFNESIRWESSKKIYKPITGITQAAPCVVTSTAHGVPDGWRIKLTNIGGMTALNSSDNYYTASVKTADTIELNDVNSVAYPTYTTGGIITYNSPVVLTGYTARMQLREKIDSTTTLDEYTTVNGKLVIDQTNFIISIIVDAVTTAAYSFSSAVYGLELVSGSGVVTALASGTITLVKEVTR